LGTVRLVEVLEAKAEEELGGEVVRVGAGGAFELIRRVNDPAGGELGGAAEEGGPGGVVVDRCVAYRGRQTGQFGVGGVAVADRARQRLAAVAIDGGGVPGRGTSCGPSGRGTSCGPFSLFGSVR
jgi:hypothetical protein